MALGKVLVAQGGGPTAVINQSLVGVVLEARRQKGVDLVYGARHGVRGLQPHLDGRPRKGMPQRIADDIFGGCADPVRVAVDPAGC